MELSVSGKLKTNVFRKTEGRPELEAYRIKEESTCLSANFSFDSRRRSSHMQVHPSRLSSRTRQTTKADS